MVKLKKNLKSNKDYSLIQLYVGEGCSAHVNGGCSCPITINGVFC